ncbi:hypothetical protein ROJ8625_02547 [Roseivivax jejudonensis]|uniref:BioF2-like acetyltransferase domain-containing protein n=1 Tax=Roseivivax jejudonensis TaxID=1529041 RepID=A0A1X6ZH81_9RHOB|nr:GNAT family N-acetyltransferase [Roseivivax jejudonensis]SLN51159.1 hypothetical protein ROJ8625_02547 [Roseivivax jejudonensis]
MLDAAPLAASSDGDVSHRIHSGSFVVETVDTHDAFRRLKPDWQALAARDPQMSVFLSWAWLDRAFRDNPGRWRVYVVRARAEGGAAVAILPLMLRARWNAGDGRLETVLVSAGRLILSDYTGMLVAPEHEDGALAALAAALSARPWTTLSLAAEIAPERARRFAACFDASAVTVVEDADAAARAASVRPVLALPESYETWLQTAPRRPFAQRIRRFERRYLGTGRRCVTITTADSFERDAAIALAPRRAALAAALGPAAAERAAANGRAVLANALGTDALMMMVLWEGDTALGALAHILDHDMDRVHVTEGGAAPDGATASVGVLLHAEAIRWAIAHGFTSYDFGPGAAPYKTAFGARSRTAPALHIRREEATAGGPLDRASLGDGLRAVSALLDAGEVASARRAAGQLAAVAT